MNLYYIPHACSLSVHILLSELDLAFELIRVDSAQKITEHGRNYLDINPNGYVPALELPESDSDNGNEAPVVITEVPAILQYLMETNPDNTLYKADSALQKAQLSADLNFLAAELHKAFVPYWYEAELTQEGRDKAFIKLDKCLTYLNKRLARTQQYLLGSQYSIADIYAFVLIRWCEFHQIELQQWPHIADFARRIEQRPAVQKAIIGES